MVKQEMDEINSKEKLFNHYYKNFEKHFLLGNLSKSTEFLWGALSSLLYAIGITYGRKLGEHSKTIEFAREISTIEEDEDIFLGVKTAEIFHANFYHNFLDKENIELKRKIIDKSIKKLSEVLEKRKLLIFKISTNL